MEKEIISNLELKHDNTIDFPEPDSRDFNSRIGDFGVEFLFLEIKSDKPPTDVSIKISYIKGNGNNVVNYKNISFIKHRKSLQV